MNQKKITLKTHILSFLKSPLWYALINRPEPNNNTFDPLEAEFSLREISEAAQIPTKTLCGTSYGAVVLDIPLPDGKCLRFRQGDDESDHSVSIVDPAKVAHD